MPFTKENAKQVGKKGGKISTRSSNLISGTARRDLARLTEYGMRKAKDWLDRVAEDDPGQALRILTSLLEYTNPKLSRREAINLSASVDLTAEERQQLIEKVAQAHGNGQGDH